MKLLILLIGLHFVICSTDASSSSSSSSESCEIYESEEQDSASFELCDDEVCIKPNEEWSPCGNHPCRDICEEPNRAFKCEFEGDCWPGCICADGYLRNKDGDCVPRGPCESSFCTRENEEYKQCGTFGQRTCANYYSAEGPGSAAVCVPGCFCKSGYVRDDDSNWNCVPIEDCGPPTCERDNEVFDACPKFDDSCFGQFSILECEPKCVCADGYLRNKEGVCVPKDQCENPCKENEKYDPCFICPPDYTCDSYFRGIVFACPAIAIADPKNCKPKCVCKEGFVRTESDGTGECVEPVICCGGPNMKVVFLTKPPSNNAIIKKCECIDGYVRDQYGQCTTPAEMPCGENEQYYPCFEEWRPRTCEAIGKKLEWEPGCKPSCECKFNYRRNSDGVCIPIQDCPPLVCDRENEVYNACPNDDSCASLYDNTNRTSILAECEPKCVCADGYLRDIKEGVCIPKDQCENPCQQNEKYDPCYSDCPPDASCQTFFLGIQPACPAVAVSNPKCEPKCLCQKGFVRRNPDKTGECIKPEACCDDPNTIIVTYPDSGPTGILKKCDCIDGYVKDENGKCVSSGDNPEVPVECGENEEYNPCGTACPRTCENKDEEIICTEQCVPGCFCKEGLVCKNGVCVDPKDCGCGANELFSPKAPTVQETCDTRGQKNKCKKGPGCVCMKGYVRKCEKGPCIKIEECEG